MLLTRTTHKNLKSLIFNTMMFPTKTATLLVILSLLIAASRCNGDGYQPAPNCADSECPAYSVVHSHKEFEIRSYEDAKWVSVVSNTSSTKSYTISAVRKGSLTLAHYLVGENGVHLTMNETYPILVGVDESRYTVYVYLPKKYQKSTPPPLKNEIKAVKLPAAGQKYAAVRRIYGDMSDRSVPKHVGALKKSLQSTPYRRAATAGVFAVAYYSPFDMENIVNEIIIWFD